MKKEHLESIISRIVTACCVFVYAVLAICALIFLAWCESRSAAALMIGFWLFLLDCLALLLALGCLVGLAFLHPYFAVRRDARRIAMALGLGLGLSALGLELFDWESGRTVLRIINDSAMPVTHISLADDQQRVPCGSVKPHSRGECVLRPSRETDLHVSLQINGTAGDWVYCGYWTILSDGNSSLRVLPSGAVQVDRHC